MEQTARARFPGRHPVWTIAIGALAALLVALVAALSNPQWLRAPLERAVSASLHRQFTVRQLHLHWSREPTLVLDDVVLGNLAGSSTPRMARVASMELTLSLPNLLRGHIVLPKVVMNDADVLLERLQDGRRNWVVGNERKSKPEKPRSRLRLGSVALTGGRVRYVDHTIPIDMTVLAHALEAQADQLPHDSDAKQRNTRYGLAYEISGRYRDNPFSGQAHSGGVLSVVDSGVPFPLELELQAGETHLRMEGTLADATQLSGIDMRIDMAGPTLANIYPLLLLPLPASPPYALHGRLRRDGPRFALEQLGGRIGSTDLEGEGTYVMREPRPLLTIRLQSKLLDMTDLGPLIGIETETRTGKPLSQAQLSTRQEAKQTDRTKRGGRVLPAGRFDPERMRVIDADVRLQAHRVRGIATVPLEDFEGAFTLRDAVLKLDAIKLGAAGGTLVARATLDARKGDVLHSEVQTEIRHVQLDRLVHARSSIAKGTGMVSLNAALSGTGNSIADAAARADGRVAATIDDGRVSNLVDAASGLAIGRVLALLATGDRDIPLNCGAAVFDIEDGKGRSSLFVLDTSQTQVLGRGHFDLGQERFDLHLEPEPKRPGLLSFRTPVDLQGSFRHVEISLEKKPLLARAGAAVALAALNPLAALIPLIETGPGENTPCAKVLQAARSAHAKDSAPSADAQ
jgi:AsmA family protein